MYQREEEYLHRNTRQVRVSGTPNTISTLVPGPAANNRFEKIWLFVDGTDFTLYQYGGAALDPVLIPVGTEFKIRCSYYAQNLAGSFTNSTTFCVTVIGEGIRRYEDTTKGNDKINFESVTLSKLQNDNKPDPVMPAGTGPLELRFKLWLNGDGSAKFPPESMW